MRFAACPFFFFFFILLALRSCAPSSGLGLSGKSPVTSLGKSQASGAFCMRVCVCVCEGVCFVFPNKGQVGQCTCPRCLQTAVTAVRAHGNSFHLKVQDYSWTLTEKRFFFFNVFFSLSKIKRRLKKSVCFFFLRYSWICLRLLDRKDLKLNICILICFCMLCCFSSFLFL